MRSKALSRRFFLKPEVGLLAALVACGSPPPISIPTPLPPEAPVQFSVFLIGDAGAPALPSEPVLVALHSELSRQPTKSLVLFLGDNLYPAGLPVEEATDRSDSERRLRAQMDAVPPNGEAVFVMGNHDWGGGSGGWDAVRRQGAFVNTRPGIRVLPADGCPGPAVLDFAENVRVITLDTQWWLHGHEKPQGPGSACRNRTRGDVMKSLREALDATDRFSIVAAHHPLLSGGVHGGRFDWKDHIFPLRAWKKWLWLPLPLIGSIYPIARSSGVASQDLSSAPYRELRDSLTAVFRDHPYATFAAGHEHNLQVLRTADGFPLLVSGAGFFGHVTKVFTIPQTVYARAASGFMRIDFLDDRQVHLTVLTVDRDGRPSVAFSMWLNDDTVRDPAGNGMGGTGTPPGTRSHDATAGPLRRFDSNRP